jgi:hypothetical protein
MPPKVCGVVSAQKPIRAEEGDGSWAIEQPRPSISPIPFTGSNLHIFPGFLNRCTRLGRLHNCRHCKFVLRERLCGVWGGGPASRQKPSGGKLSLGHGGGWPREWCRE